MAIVERLRNEDGTLEDIDGHAFAGTVYCWLTNAAGLGASVQAKAITQWNLDADDLADMALVLAVYNGKSPNLAKLDYAIRVKCILEMVQSNSGGSYFLSVAEIKAVLEI